MIGKMLLLIMCGFFLLALNASIGRSLQINEIMYNPSSDMGADSDLEWIELFHSGENISLSGYSIRINDKLFQLPEMELGSDSYFILARELNDSTDEDNDSFFDHYGHNFTAAELKFSLPNTAGVLSLSRANDTIQEVSYSEEMGADGNGFSLELFNQTLYESEESGGTPGRENSITSGTPIGDGDEGPAQPPTTGLRLSVYLDDVLYTGIEYDKLFKVDNLDHQTGVRDCINATIRYEIYQGNTTFRVDFAPIICMNSVKTAETGMFMTYSAGEYMLCGQLIEATSNFTNNTLCKNFSVFDTSQIDCNVSLTGIELDKFIYEEKEKIGYGIGISNRTYPFLIRYSITDLFGNFIRTERNTTNTNKKSFTPSGLNEADKVYSINAELIPLCNDLNLSDNRVSEFLVVKQASSQEPGSVITIKEILTKEARFGSAVLSNIVIYKGDTLKKVIKIFATTKDGRKVSEETKVYLKDRFTSYEFNIPVELDADCSKKREPGIYYLVVEGLGEKEKQRFRIKGWDEKECPKPINLTDLCKGRKTSDDKRATLPSMTKNDSMKKGLNAEQIPENVPVQEKNGSSRVTGRTVYRSASVKSVGLLPYMFFITSLMISLLIIFRKL